MKAVAQKQKGGVEVLQVLELPKPVPNENDVLVKVIAVATNPVDGKIRSGSGPVDPPKVLGFDCAGVVEAVGAKVKSFKAGDEVYFAGSNAKNGSNAEYTVVDQRIIAHKPKTLNWEQAASLPLVVLTAWEAMSEGSGIPIPTENGPNPNSTKSILVLGGAGGVGSIAIQLAKKVFKFGHVIATASRDETTNWCKKQGADHVINHQNKLLDQLVQIGFPKGVHYFFCTTDLNKTFEAAVEATRPAGKIMGITGFAGLDTSKIFQKRIGVISEYMFARIINDEEPELQGQILEKVAHLVDSGVLHHIANHHFEWSDIKKAHELQDSGKAIGKITLTVKF